MISINKRYLSLFVLLLLVEITIAAFVRDNFVRPYLGDFLVVMLIYCFLKSFLKIKVALAAIIVLLFAFLVELFQYFQITEVLELREVTLATTVLGTQFDWMDILAYTSGIVAILIIEKLRESRSGLKI